MSRQTSLFDYERDTPQEIIERIQQQAREVVEDRRDILLLEFVPASRLYDCERRERVPYDWPGDEGVCR